MKEAVCDGCYQPITDNSYLCHKCSDRLRQALLGIVDHFDQLDVTVNRQAKIGDSSGGGKANEVPLMFNVGASENRWIASNTITTWARVVSDGTGYPPVVSDRPRSGPACLTDCRHPLCQLIRWRVVEAIEAQLARWLAGQIPWIRNRPEAAEMLEEIADAFDLIERTLDRPGPREYAGPCDVCGKDMYVRPQAKAVTCTPCELTYEVEPRRKVLLDKAEDILGGATLIARAVTNLGSPVTPERLRKWAERGHLIAAARDARGYPMYRVGDVLELLRTEKEKAIRAI